MTLWTELARANNSGGDEIILRRRGQIYEIRYNGMELMSNLNHQSEEILAKTPISAAGPSARRLFIGGLGMGFTLRASLDHLPMDAEVVVCELIPEIVAWNQSHLGHLTNHPLSDPRVTTRVGDALDALRQNPEQYDLILMDTDNGPDHMVREENASFYESSGLHSIRSALKPGGIACFWSATRSVVFEGALDASAWHWKRERVVLSETSIEVEHHIYFAGDSFSRERPVHLHDETRS